jgi:hypothetical protein
MFRLKRKVTLEDFAQECVRFALSGLSMSTLDQVKFWNSAIEMGADPHKYLHETVFFSCFQMWQVLMGATAEKKITPAQWMFLNERFLNSISEEIDNQPLKESPWSVPLYEVLHERLGEYRDATDGLTDKAAKVDAMCRVYAKACSGDPSNPKLYGEANTVLVVGTRKLIDVIAGVKFIT